MLLLGAAAAGPDAIFRDATDQAGITFRHVHGGNGRRYLPETMGAGGCVLDADGDGRMDVFLVQSGALTGPPDPAAASRLYRNAGDGTLVDVTAQAGLVGGGYGQGAACADYDGDGRTDIFVAQLGPDRLWRNTGGGRFQDVTAAAGASDTAWSVSAAFFDADGDGDLDLYVANYVDFSLERHRDCVDRRSGQSVYCHPDVYPPAPDSFFRNRGDGRFEEAGDSVGFRDRTGKGLGVVAADFDDDGRVDVFVANDSTPNFLFHNLGRGRFEERALVLGVAFNEEGRTQAGMGVDAGDVDGDGRLDIIVTNLSREANSLFLGGVEQFTYGTRRAGLYEPSFKVLGFGVHMADVDNDGDLDLVVVNGDVLDNVESIDDGLTWRQPGQVFLNDGTGRFLELAPDRVGDLALPRVGRGSMLLDYDDDGRQDLLVSYNGDRARLYHHEGRAGRFLGLSLHAPAPNTAAIGARVTVESGGRRQIREVRAGSSYASSSDPRLHFGLGDAEAAERVTIRWPDGHVQSLSGLATGRYHELHHSCPGPGQAGSEP
jgi:hypothetical protein